MEKLKGGRENRKPSCLPGCSVPFTHGYEIIIPPDRSEFEVSNSKS